MVEEPEAGLHAGQLLRDQVQLIVLKGILHLMQQFAFF
jgi:hypothetical protein